MTSSPDPGSEQHEIVEADRAGSFLVRVGGRDQSLVDLIDPTRLAFDYVRRMGDVLDTVGPPGEPLRVLHVGGAGLTLPRYVATTRPRSSQIVLEPDAALTESVRGALPLPRRSGIKVRPVDGMSGLAVVRESSVDAVVLDAYVDGKVPPELLAVPFFGAVVRVLAPGGLFLLNLSDGAPFASTRDVVAGLRTCCEALVVSAEPATLRGRRPGNVLVVAGVRVVPVQALERSARTSPSPYRVLSGGDVGSSFGGGTPR